jgi:hypothetical protein
MATKKIVITQKIVNNKPAPVMVTDTVDTEVIDGNVVALQNVVNAGVVTPRT